MNVSDERTTTNGAGRRRRRGAHSYRGTLLRFAPDVADALEDEARRTGESKVLIVEQLLRRRYRLKAS